MKRNDVYWSVVRFFWAGVLIFGACTCKEPKRTVVSDERGSQAAAMNPEPPSPPPMAPDGEAGMKAAPEEAAPAQEPPKPEEKAPDPAMEDPSKPLTEAQEKAFAGIAGEKLGETREHYYTSNETRYDLWYPQIQELGGAYMGVGPDQNYSLAAVANSRLVILMDYDVEVLGLHRMYMVLVRICEQPECVLAMLDRRKTDEVAQKAREWFDEPAVKLIRTIHKGASTVILKNHRARIKQGLDKGGRFWLTDAELYRRWRTLVLSGRVKVFAGDLTKGQTMTQVAAALKEIRMPLRILYFSNAEEFWHYPQAFRDAIAQFPFDEKSQVLRTVTLGDEFKIGWLFHYTIQNAADFLAWMKVPGRYSIKAIARLRRDPIDGTKYYSRLPAPPEGVKMPQ